MKYFKVKIGYGADDFIRIEEDEVEKAMVAQMTGRVVIFKRAGSIAGNSIIGVLPDYHRELGVNREYVLKERDYQELGSKQKKYEEFLENTSHRIAKRLGNVGSSLGSGANLLSGK